MAKKNPLEHRFKQQTARVAGKAANAPRLLHVSPASIHSDPKQPRKAFDKTSLRELANSIRQVGLLQPLGVVSREGSKDEYNLAFGERRLRAGKIAGLNAVPVLLFAPDQHEHIQAIENLQREDLKPLEEAGLYARLAEEHEWSQSQLAKFVGKNRTTVNKILRINDLPAKIKKDAAASSVSKEVLIQVATAEPGQQLRLWNAVRYGASKRDTRSTKRRVGVGRPTPLAERVLRTGRRFVGGLEKLPRRAIKDDILKELQQIHRDLGSQLKSLQAPKKKHTMKRPKQ